MEKINVVLVLLNANKLREALSSLNFNRANLVAVVVEGGNGNFLTVDKRRVPLISFASIGQLLNAGKNFVWLLNGHVNDAGDLWSMKKFLTANGVPEDNIVNFERWLTAEWFANLRYVERHGADFFATGISYAEVGLDLNFIPHVRGRGVNLSGSNQDLRQGYLTAKHIFERVKPGTIKFVLIGLAPYSFRYDNAKAFAVTSRHLQYMIALDAPARNRHDELLTALTSDDVKKYFATLTAEQADLNFSRTKKNLSRELPVKAVVNWEAELRNLTKKLYPVTVEENFRILKAYIKLCRDNGAKPVGVVLPFAPAMHDNYSAELLTLFRLAIRELEETTDFTCVDLFDLRLGYDCFYNMAHLNLRGAAIASSLLGAKLHEQKLLPTENFCGMNYEYFNLLSNLLPRDEYNALMNQVFDKSVEPLRRKDKLKIGFVLYDSSMWCGDELYDLFARDERFEPTIFLCLRTDKTQDELVRKDFAHGAEQFKSHGRNVVALVEKNSPVEPQDVLIYLTPYLNVLPDAFQPSKLTARTLVAYIPYAFNATTYEISDYAIFHTAWKVFFESNFSLKLFDAHSKLGMPRGLLSGYPKLDALLDGRTDFHFNWKTTRPDAKKIIYAPHWSINKGVKYSTFHLNGKFMYEFARSHPETSWVVKPHPNLLYSAVKSGLFKSAADFEAYLQAWNELPNAQVVTGGYYLDIFATSDGLIHDGGSFIAEYQFTHKPSIFLTRDTQKFNELGRKILDASYLVDGSDTQAIAELIKKVFVDGEDFKRDERRKVFDELLNWRRVNGTSASEFIFRNIVDALQ